MSNDMLDSPNSIPNRELITQLELASKDMLWLSEAEYPLQIIYWQNTDEFDRNTLLKRYNYPADTKIAIQEFYSFFDSVTKPEPWHNEAEQLEVKKFQTIVDLLAQNLTDLKVYLLAEVEIDVYILGKTKERAIAGLTTKIVRT